MGLGQSRAFSDAATIGAAAIGCLQPGIDPVFLTLLSSAHDLDPDLHGWVVAATQGGMAFGALIAWRYRPALPRSVSSIAACIALLSSLATVFFSAFLSLVLVRTVFGIATGLIYTDAMTEAATRRPATAYGAVFLVQLILSTIVAMTLPYVSDAAGPQIALLVLAMAPLAAAGLLLISPHGSPVSMSIHDPVTETAQVGSQGAWLLAVATFTFICATMMVWSFTGALAMRYGFAEDVIGFAVAIGSIAGALTALTIIRAIPIVALPITGFFASIGLFAPLILMPMQNDWLFIGAIALLNIGSTAIIVRGSSFATMAGGDAPVFRRFVACTHPLGMIAGPALGAILTQASGPAGLEGGAFTALTLGCLLLLFASRRVRDRSVCDESVTA